MRANNLSNATCHVIDSYGKTASHAINAYRTGGHRVVQALQARWNHSLSAAQPRLGAGVARNANALQQRLQQAALTGLSFTSGGAQSLVKQIVQIADAGVHSVADNALWLEDRLGTQALSKLSQLALPAVTTLGTLASQLEQQSARLAHRVAGRPPLATKARRVRAGARKARVAVASH